MLFCSAQDGKTPEVRAHEHNKETHETFLRAVQDYEVRLSGMTVTGAIIGR